MTWFDVTVRFSHAAHARGYNTSLSPRTERILGLAAEKRVRENRDRYNSDFARKIVLKTYGRPAQSSVARLGEAVLQAAHHAKDKWASPPAVPHMGGHGCGLALPRQGCVVSGGANCGVSFRACRV